MFGKFTTICEHSKEPPPGMGEGSVEWGRDQPGRMLRLSYRFMRWHWAEVVSFISSSCYLAEGLVGMVSIK